MIEFERDPSKARANLRKHGVSFEDAMLVFDDPYALFQKERRDDAGEQRWHALGLAGGVTVLVVVHTVREEVADEIVRIISVRRATRKEQNRYDQNRAQNTV